MPIAPAPFVKKTYELVSDTETNNIVSWSEKGDSFIIWKPHLLQTEILPKYFKHNNISSFIRQLNTYEFRKVVVTEERNRKEELEFKNPCFLRDDPELLCEISRKRPGKRTATQRDASEILGNCINAMDPLRNLTHQELANIANSCLEQPMDSIDDIKALMSDNNAMRKAIVSLSEKQLRSENMLNTVTQELCEAKRLIEILKQERNFPNGPLSYPNTNQNPVMSNYEFPNLTPQTPTQWSNYTQDNIHPDRGTVFNGLQHQKQWRNSYQTRREIQQNQVQWDAQPSFDSQ